jgi:hypothetical protein
VRIEKENRDLELDGMTVEQLETTYEAFMLLLRSPLCNERNRAWVQEVLRRIDDDSGVVLHEHGMVA